MWPNIGHIKLYSSAYNILFLQLWLWRVRYPTPSYMVRGTFAGTRIGTGTHGLGMRQNPGGFTWLYVVLHGYWWLYVVICGFTWL